MRAAKNAEYEQVLNAVRSWSTAQQFLDEDNPNQQQFTVSVVELPQAPAQPWVQPQPTIAKGHLQRHTFQSSILRNERRL